jgi:hypothetical protein
MATIGMREPGGADNVVSRIVSPDCLLSGQLASAIGGDKFHAFPPMTVSGMRAIFSGTYGDDSSAALANPSLCRPYCPASMALHHSR